MPPPPGPPLHSDDWPLFVMRLSSISAELKAAAIPPPLLHAPLLVMMLPWTVGDELSILTPPPSNPCSGLALPRCRVNPPKHGGGPFSRNEGDHRCRQVAVD